MDVKSLYKPCSQIKPQLKSPVTPSQRFHVQSAVVSRIFSMFQEVDSNLGSLWPLGPAQIVL